MGRIKWLLLGLVLVYVLLEALLLSYRSLFQRLRPTTARTGTVTRQAHKLPVEEADVLFDEVSRFSVNMIAPRDLAAWPDGGVVVGDRRMIVFSPDGAVADDIELTYEPMCVAVDAATNVYVGMQNHIVLFPAGVALTKPGQAPRIVHT